MEDRFMYIDKDGDVVPDYMYEDAIQETVTLDENGNEIDPVEKEKELEKDLEKAKPIEEEG